MVQRPFDSWESRFVKIWTVCNLQDEHDMTVTGRDRHDPRKAMLILVFYLKPKLSVACGRLGWMYFPILYIYRPRPTLKTLVCFFLRCYVWRSLRCRLTALALYLRLGVMPRPGEFVLYLKNHANNHASLEPFISSNIRSRINLELGENNRQGSRILFVVFYRIFESLLP